VNLLLDAKFMRALQVVLGFEGGYVDNAKDPGGATNHGITQRTYDSWCRWKGISRKSVKDIPDQDVAQIYREDYWTPLHCDEFPFSVSVVLFDTAVQWGVNGTIVDIVMRIPALRGFPGPSTAVFERLRSLKPELLIDQVVDRRISFRYERVKKKPSQIIFFHGWLNRDRKLKEIAMQALPKP
jgi:lysozyme family protein